MKAHDPVRGYCIPCFNDNHADCRENDPDNTICCGCGHFEHAPKSEWPVTYKAPPKMAERRPTGLITGGWDDEPPPPPKKRTIKRR